MMEQEKQYRECKITALDVETPCLICGEGIPSFGFCYEPKICEKCKAAVMKVRGEYGN